LGSRASQPAHAPLGHTAGRQASGMASPAPAETARSLRAALGLELCVCILGGTKIQEEETAALIRAIATRLPAALGERAAFVTGGMAGVQQLFAEHCGEASRLWHLLPEGEASGFSAGEDVGAGRDLDERKAIFGQLGDIYLTFEGGPGVAAEARAATERGAVVLPLARTGGASGGMFDFPKAALERPAFATDAQWALLQHTDGSVEDCMEAVLELARKATARQPSFEDLIGVDRGTVAKVVGVVSLIVLLVCGCVIYADFSRGRVDLALTQGGLLVLYLALVAAVAWTVSSETKTKAD